MRDMCLATSGDRPVREASAADESRGLSPRGREAPRGVVRRAATEAAVAAMRALPVAMDEPGVESVLRRLKGVTEVHAQRHVESDSHGSGIEGARSRHGGC